MLAIGRQGDRRERLWNSFSFPPSEWSEDSQTPGYLATSAQQRGLLHFWRPDRRTSRTPFGILEAESPSWSSFATMLLPEQPVPGVSRKTLSYAVLLASPTLRSLRIP